MLSPMKLAFFVLMFGDALLAQDRLVSSSIVSGDAMTYDLGYGIKLNGSSSLSRSWHILNDSSSPLQLGSVGISPGVEKTKLILALQCLRQH
jgi:hypothetical protein